MNTPEPSQRGGPGPESENPDLDKTKQALEIEKLKAELGQDAGGQQ